jgi:hypothetical protein
MGSVRLLGSRDADDPEFMASRVQARIGRGVEIDLRATEQLHEILVGNPAMNSHVGGQSQLCAVGIADILHARIGV